jgi:hypothetical protein
MTDYPYLARAEHYAAGIAALPQVLSTMVHYQVGVFLGGGILWFAATNVLFLATMCVCWGLLLRRAGWSRDAAVIASGMLAVAPGTSILLRWGDGVEHLSASACLMLVLLLTDIAARDDELPSAWRYGVLIVALALSALGVLMKWALMVLIPPSCWLWGRWVVARPSPPMHRSFTYVLFFVVVVGTIVMLPQGETSVIGFLPSRTALRGIANRVLQSGGMTLLLIMLAEFGRTKRDTRFFDSMKGMFSPLAAVARQKVGRMPIVVWALALSSLWFLPFALHASYEGAIYYGMLASAPVSAVGAALIAAAAASWKVGRVSRWLVACCVGVMLVPLGEIQSDWKDAADEVLPDWIDSVRTLTSSLTPPDHIVVIPSCARSAEALSPRQQIDPIFGENGIWWATGWYETPIEVRDEAGSGREGATPAGTVLTLGYCPGHPATIL